MLSGRFSSVLLPFLGYVILLLLPLVLGNFSSQLEEQLLAVQNADTNEHRTEGLNELIRFMELRGTVGQKGTEDVFDRVGFCGLY